MFEWFITILIRHVIVLSLNYVFIQAETTIVKKHYHKHIPHEVL